MCNLVPSAPPLPPLPARPAELAKPSYFLTNRARSAARRRVSRSSAVSRGDSNPFSLDSEFARVSKRRLLGG